MAPSSCDERLGESDFALTPRSRNDQLTNSFGMGSENPSGQSGQSALMLSSKNLNLSASHHANRIATSISDLTKSQAALPKNLLNYSCVAMNGDMEEFEATKGQAGGGASSNLKFLIEDLNALIEEGEAPVPGTRKKKKKKKKKTATAGDNKEGGNGSDDNKNNDGQEEKRVEKKNI